jgi:hypothetical protein
MMGCTQKVGTGNECTSLFAPFITSICHGGERIWNNGRDALFNGVVDRSVSRLSTVRADPPLVPRGSGAGFAVRIGDRFGFGRSPLPQED